MTYEKEINQLATNLNDIIKKNNPYVFDMLSETGKRIYFPKGVLSQTRQANEKGVKYNATIGMATENNQPMHLGSINAYFKNISLKEIFPYAPSTGVKKLRELWKKSIYSKNPSLKSKIVSSPVITVGLTHAITSTANMFVNSQDTVLVPDKMWGNYKLVFKERRNADLQTYKIFDNNLKFDIEGIREKFINLAKKKSKLAIVINFPNNPTGYSLTKEEAKKFINIIKELPDYNCNVIIIFDDAYFGLFYEENTYKESLFSELACCSDRILAIKSDATTKELFVWGFRLGFLTFATKSNNQEELYAALEKKAAGIIRSTVSSSSNPLQHIILKAMTSSNFLSEIKNKSIILKERYVKVKEIVYKEKYLDEWDVYPFNSGYFMCIRLKNVNAEELRIHLLNEYSLGTISTSPTDLRIAFSCLETNIIEEVFELIYKGIKDLKNENPKN